MVQPILLDNLALASHLTVRTSLLMISLMEYSCYILASSIKNVPESMIATNVSPCAIPLHSYMCEYLLHFVLKWRNCKFDLPESISD